MLATPLEWQADVIRAAITLKLCVHEETGAIVAALTTSIPEAANSGRNWDYRYCWLRDAYYTVQALNRLGAADILEGYLGYLRNIIDATPSGRIQPLYGVGMEPILQEAEITSLPAIAAWARYASATRRTNTTSTTSMARSCSPACRPSTTHASSARGHRRFPRTRKRRRTRLRRATQSPTRGSGNFARAPAYTPIPL
jgi:hypothetical protein